MAGAHAHGPGRRSAARRGSANRLRHVGHLVVDGTRKKLWALVVTLTVGRYVFVWPLLRQHVLGRRPRERD